MFKERTLGTRAERERVSDRHVLRETPGTLTAVPAALYKQPSLGFAEVWSRVSTASVAAPKGELQGRRPRWDVGSPLAALLT